MKRSEEAKDKGLKKIFMKRCDYSALMFAIKIVLVYGAVWLLGVFFNLIFHNTLTRVIVAVLTIFHAIVLPLIGAIALIYLIKINMEKHVD